MPALYSQEEALLKSDDDDPMNSDKELDDDDDDSEEEQDEEERLIKEYLETLGQIDQNKYGYENYVQLIEIAQ